MKKNFAVISLVSTLALLNACSNYSNLPDIERETDRYLTCADLSKQISDNQKIDEAAQKNDRDSIDSLVPTALVVPSYNVSKAGVNARKRVKHLIKVYDRKKCDEQEKHSVDLPAYPQVQQQSAVTPPAESEPALYQIPYPKTDGQYAVQPQQPQYIIASQPSQQQRPQPARPPYYVDQQQLPPAQLPADPANVPLYETGPTSSSGTTPAY